MTKKFDYGIVISKSVSEYPPAGATPRDFDLQLTAESKIAALAGGLVLEEGLVKYLIFTGGKTSGENFPSEARLMKDYLSKKVPSVDAGRIILEEKAMNTIQQAKFTKKILQERNALDRNPLKRFLNPSYKHLLITPEYQAERARLLFNRRLIGLSGVIYSPEILACFPRGKGYADLSERLLEESEKSDFLKSQLKVEEWLTPFVKYVDFIGLYGVMSSSLLRRENCLRGVLNKRISN